MLAFTSVPRRQPCVLQVDREPHSVKIPSFRWKFQPPRSRLPSKGFDGEVTRAQRCPRRTISICDTVLLWLRCRTFFRRHTDGTLLLLNIGDTIRNCWLQKGLSQGDLEQRTGLLRCYLSRVENGHTIPSLGTLAKIAGAMAVPLSQFFSDWGPGGNGSRSLSRLSENEVRFLRQIQRDAANLNESDRKLVLAMAKKMAAKAVR